MTISIVCTDSKPRPARARRALAASVLAPLVCLVGCVTAESTIKPDGSGTFEITYRTAPDSTTETEKRRYTSDHVTVESASVTSATTATVKGHFDDCTKISSAEGFKNARVTRSQDGADTRLTITITNPVPLVVTKEGQPGPKITLRLPGAVREANHNAKIDISSVTWSFSFVEWMKEKSITLTVRYAAAAADAKAGAAEAPKEPPPDAPKEAAKDAPKEPPPDAPKGPAKDAPNVAPADAPKGQAAPH